jgi:hypothetical protein
MTAKHKRSLKESFPAQLLQERLFSCEKCNFSCSKQSGLNIHENTTKHKKRINVFIPVSLINQCECNRVFETRSGLYKHKQKCTFLFSNTPPVDQNDEMKQMVISYMQNQEFMQTMITTLAENQQKQTEHNEKQLEFQNKLVESIPTLGSTNIQTMITTLAENQQKQLEFQNKLVESLPTLGTTNNIQTQNNTTFNLNTYLTIDCKDAETLDETKLRLKEYILGLDTISFIEHAANSSSTAIMEKVIRGFYSNIEPCKRSIQTVDVARGKSYVKHTEENGFILDEEGNAVSVVARNAGHYSINHCIKYKNTMKNPNNSWKNEFIGRDYDSVDNKINNMWRFTDANTNMAKKLVGGATKIDKSCV